MDISNVVMTEFTASAVVVYVMQQLKSAKWFPLVEEGRAILNRLISIGTAAFVAVGISWSWTKNPQGTHDFLIQNIGMWAVIHGFWHWLNQYCLQETIYQATTNKPAITHDSAGAVPVRMSPQGALVVPPAVAPGV